MFPTRIHRHAARALSLVALAISVSTCAVNPVTGKKDNGCLHSAPFRGCSDGAFVNQSFVEGCGEGAGRPFNDVG